MFPLLKDSLVEHNRDGLPIGDGMPLVTVKPPTGCSIDHVSDRGSLPGESRFASRTGSPHLPHSINPALMKVIEEAENAKQSINVEEVVQYIFAAWCTTFASD